MFSTSESHINKPIQVWIDPLIDSNQHPDHYGMLLCLLAKQGTRRAFVFHKNQPYLIKLRDRRIPNSPLQTYAVTLTHDIVVRQNEDKTFFYEVVDGEIETEHFVKTYKVARVIRHIDITNGRAQIITPDYERVHEAVELDLAQPETLSPEANRWIVKILNCLTVAEATSVNHQFIPRHIKIARPDNREIYYIKFKHAVIIRPREHHPDEKRYEVIIDKLGKGSSGTAYEIATLKETSEGTLDMKRSDRVFKSQPHLIHDSSLLEHYISSAFKQRGSKTPFLFSSNQKEIDRSGRIERKAAGAELKKIIRRINKKPQPTDTDLRLQLTKIIIEKLIGIHGAGYVHRDIKPENILAEDKLPTTAEIIDFGLSRHYTENDRGENPCGTPLYMAPEVYDEDGSSGKSDIYSLGVVFGELWGAIYHPAIERACYLSETDVLRATQLVNIFSHNYQFYKLFNRQCDLNGHEKMKIEKILRSMVECDPGMRPDLHSLLTDIEEIILERQIQSLPDPLNTIERRTHESAAKARKLVYEQIKRYSVREFMSKLANVTTLRDILTENTKDIINIISFVNFFGAVVFKDCIIRDNILRRFDQLTFEYSALCGRHSVTRDRIVNIDKMPQDGSTHDTHKTINKILKELKLVTGRRERLSMTLDNLAYFNKKWLGAIVAAENKLDALELAHSKEQDEKTSQLKLY